MTNQIHFEDGAAYERYMGEWSQLAGDTFLTWLDPPPGLRWLDVGCGSGAFTEMIAERSEPASVHGLDPSMAQLAYARARVALQTAHFHHGDAMALPFPDHVFDAAVMPLVIFFVPDPAKGVAEMARVVCPGGLVAAYAWDMVGGHFPYAALLEELRGLGVDVPEAPSNYASRLEILRDLWDRAGLEAIDTQVISVERTFADFDDYWATIHGSPSASARLASMTDEQRTLLASRLRARLPADGDGRITYSAKANAVRGRVP
ncbi:MAG TPA: methyltransferase domain-containing protein [Vicinamibacterales bacterium]|nr:methyltransferase domain-containing protein [Vicinamibacterales bacterium]